MTVSKPFASWNSFSAFSNAVRYQSRFFQDRRINAFLRALSDSAERRVLTIGTTKALWRAQVGFDNEEQTLDGVTYEEPVPYKAERMKPLRTSAYEGRVNPKGIPCLYVASKKETAVSEVRPWLGALVSVAQMKVQREIRLVNCSEGHNSSLDLYFEEPDPSERETAVWRAISRGFSEPVSPDPGVAEYAPTQVLAEHFKKIGYDGVVYASKLADGFNVALFDLEALSVIDVRLYPVKAVRYEIGEMKNSYVVKHKRIGA